MKKISLVCCFVTMVIMLGACKKEVEEKPELYCGTDFSLSCLNEKWIIKKSDAASYHILPDYEGRKCLLLVNPHDPTKYNEQDFRLNSFIKNIRPNAVYQISCDVKIKGYPIKNQNSPSFMFYAFTNDNWYGELYYGSDSMIYHEKDWTTMKYNFTSGSDESLEFELSSMYDSLWISNLTIKEL